MSSVKPSVKAIFMPSAKKKHTKSAASSSTTNGQSPSYLRPLTPESVRKKTPSSPTSEPHRGIFSQRSSSPAPSPLQNRRTVSSDASSSRVENGLQLSQSVPDLRYGVKHVRSSSQPSKSAASTPHRESFSSVTFPDRSNSVNSEGSYYNEVADAPMILQEDIIALTVHVRTFSEALSSLRNTFIECEENPDGDPPEVKAHERLGEVLSVLKGVLNKYQPLHSTDILASAGTLISKVKSHNYEDTSKAPDEFYESIDQLALAFSSSVSDFLMGEQDMVLSESAMYKQHSESLEDFCDEEEDYDDRGYDEDNEDDQDHLEYRDERKSSEKKESCTLDTSAEKADELDRALIQLEHGVEIAMQRTKIWTKYSKDIESYIDKRAHLELEYTTKLAKLALATRAAITEENYLPFQSIFVTALEQDIDYAENANRTYAGLMSSKFMEPLTLRRNTHERMRKELKETWAKACRKMSDALGNLEKAKKLYIQKQQELEKEDSSSASLTSFTRGTKKKEGDMRKADEAEEVYKQAVHDANARQRELECKKSKVLVELRQLVYQCDMTMKAVTCNYFQMMNTLASPAPVQFQTLAESSRNYEPGNQFSEFVRLQQANSPQAVCPIYQFEPYSAISSDKGPPAPSRQTSMVDGRNSQTQAAIEEVMGMSPFIPRRHKSLTLHGSSNVNNVQSAMNSWSHLKENNSDAESTTSRSLPGSPSGSPTMTRKGRNIPRAQSLEFMSSDDGDNRGESRRNGPVIPGSRRNRPAKNRPPAGPFQNSRLSSAAQTHRLKKLRSASKCRDCDSYVYFNGAECEVCGLTCHKKCLAKLSIECGTYTKVQRRMTTFGVDFQRHLQDSTTEEENIPHIITSCIDEIDQRGLDVKGIYRVSGVKSRVEKLCQAFENGVFHADLSDTPPHVIAAVLKLYLRQLPESLLTFRLYPEFIRIAKESFSVISNSRTCKEACQNEDLREDYDNLIQKLREIVMQLPTANRVTAERVIKHLKRVSEHDEANAMPGSNLAIVFGPTLLRPCENEATSTLSALVEMPHQTRLVELLIASPEVFDLPYTDDSRSRDTPVEKFTPPVVLDRKDSVVTIQSLRSATGAAQDESYEGGDEASFINTPESNSSQSVLGLTPPRPRQSSSLNALQQSTKLSVSPSPSTGSSLGFGSDFFELLARSNSRSDEKNAHAGYSIPEFLLSESSQKVSHANQEDSDIEDEYEDDTTQGTSGSRTPEDDLDTSQFPRQISSSKSSHEHLAEENKPNVTKDAINLVMSRSSSSYSVAPSFTSDIPDSLLPDLSDKVGSDKMNDSEGVGLPDEVVKTTSIRTWSYSGETSAKPRPRTLALVKRNSDLPGRVQRADDFKAGFFPTGMKSSNSDTNLHKDPYAIEEVPFIPNSEGSEDTVESPLNDELQSIEEDSQFNGQNLSIKETEPVNITLTSNRDAELSPLEGAFRPETIPIEYFVSPVQSPTNSELPSPSKTQAPPVSKKPARSPVVENKEFVPAAESSVGEVQSGSEVPAGVESRALIVPVMTALQERRPSTPDCSTAKASNDTKVPGRVQSPDESPRKQEMISAVDEKKSDVKALTRSAYTTRVSVKDRMQQYERNRSLSTELGRRNSSELFNPNPVASRKQLFERGERGGYKRVGDINAKNPRSDSGSGSSSASGSPKLSRKRVNGTGDASNASPVSGSPKFRRKRVNDSGDVENTKPVEQEKQAEPRRRRRNNSSEKSDRPPSLVLDNQEQVESVKSSRPRSGDFSSLKLDLPEEEKERLTKKTIDIPFEEHPSERLRSERPRRSPNTSPRSSRGNVRTPFPDDSAGENREPQFV